MPISARARVSVALCALLLAGCGQAESPAGSTPATISTPTETPTPPEALVGSYSVVYKDTESDRDAIDPNSEGVVRAARVTESCMGSDCSLVYTTELKAPDGSIATSATALTFDGSTYLGVQTAQFACDGWTTLTTVEGGLEYTSESTITPTSTAVKDGRDVIATFEIVLVSHNEITAAGREAGCGVINLSGPDPYASNTTTVGVGTRVQDK